jgi:hypothetical protein
MGFAKAYKIIEFKVRKHSYHPYLVNFPQGVIAVVAYRERGLYHQT